MKPQIKQQSNEGAKVNRNPSNKSAEELARIWYEDLFPKVTPGALFDASIDIQAIYHLPHMLGENCCDGLRELIEDGELDAIFGRELKEPCDLVRVSGFIVVANCQKYDFCDTIFDSDGYMDSCHSDSGVSFIVMGYGPDLDAAYLAMVEHCIKRQATTIEAGLKEVAL